MKKETVDMLMRTIGDLFHASAESQLRINALETVLQKHSPEQYDDYQEALSALKRKDAPAINLGFVASLQEALLRE